MAARAAGTADTAADTTADTAAGTAAGPVDVLLVRRFVVLGQRQVHHLAP